MRILFLVVWVVVPCLNAQAAEVRVFAAASLTDALKEIAALYEVASGEKIVFNFGASSTLARQIQEGAPADLFVSADQEKMDVLQRAKLIVDGTRVTLLSNTLVIVVSRDGGIVIRSPRDLASRRVTSLALAEPQSVPAGIYARRYLQKIGIWKRVQSKVIPTDNVRSALSAVASGNADAAIVYKTDALISRKVRVVFEVPLKEGPPISYPFAVLREGENQAGARRFLVYLASDAALNVFVRHGFLLHRP